MESEPRSAENLHWLIEDYKNINFSRLSIALQNDPLAQSATSTLESVLERVQASRANLQVKLSLGISF